MVRLVKLIKQSSKVFKQIREFFNISPGFERLVLFIMGIFMIFHVVGCLWIIVPQLANSVETTWLADFSD
jgi:hypothetical protein